MTSLLPTGRPGGGGRVEGRGVGHVGTKGK